MWNCSRYTWTVNNTAYNASGEYSVVIGCKTEILNLTITASTSNTTTISACESYTWAVNNTTYSSNGEYSVVNGCHTEILKLTITESTTNTTTISACDSYTWPVNNVTYTASVDVSITTGCNTEILELTITEPTSNTTTISTCGNYTWPVNGATYTAPGTYTSVSGCRTDRLELTITAAPTWYLDADGDRYYTGTGITQCTSPGTGYTSTGLLGGSDCNDSNPLLFAPITYYQDQDKDGFGSTRTTTACSLTAPAGHSSKPGDCNDKDVAIYPDAPEICDGKDNNCNGLVDDKCQPPLTLSINDVSMAEGNSGKKTMVFTVTLSHATTANLNVFYSTQNGTASAGSDYVAATGNFTIKPGALKQTISITILGDRLPEANETFTVTIGDVKNVTFIKPTGIGTITNDDGGITASTRIEPELATTPTTSIAPNPARQIANLQLNGYHGLVNIKVMTAEGKMLQEQKLQLNGGKTQVPINVSMYANGRYFITVTDEKGNLKTEKLVIIH